MEIVNLTPHPLVIQKKDGEKVTIAPSGLARVAASYVEDSEVFGISVGHTQYGAVEGLPEEKEGTLYVVSSLVRCALPSRHDLVSPTNMIRDAEGRIVGAAALTR